MRRGRAALGRAGAQGGGPLTGAKTASAGFGAEGGGDMGKRRRWAAPALRAAAVVLVAGALAGCLELDVKETVRADGSVLSGEFSYSVVIPEELEEMDLEEELGFGVCMLPSAGDPLPPGADFETWKLAGMAQLLGLVKTRDSKVGETVYCAWDFRVDLDEWEPAPDSPLFAHVEYTETPRPGWWLYQVPPGMLMDDELAEWTIKEMLGSVRMTSTVSGPGVIGKGYARQDDGSWLWEGSLADMLEARPRYWVPG